MHNLRKGISRRVAAIAAATLISAAAPVAASATEWTGSVGAQAPDLTHTALAFLPNEFWIHAGDSIPVQLCHRRTPYGVLLETWPDASARLSRTSALMAAFLSGVQARRPMDRA